MVHFKFKNFSDFRKAYFQLIAQKNADERLAAKYELLSPSDKLINVDPKNSVRGPQTAQKEPAHMYKAIAQNYGTQQKPRDRSTSQSRLAPQQQPLVQAQPQVYRPARNTLVQQAPPLQAQPPYQQYQPTRQQQPGMLFQQPEEKLRKPTKSPVDHQRL